MNWKIFDSNKQKVAHQSEIQGLWKIVDVQQEKRITTK